jgi:ribosomal protein L32
MSRNQRGEERMSNKQQTAMKLYTEEHLKLFYQLGKFDGIARRETDVEEEIKNHLPTELPSDSLCINCDESKSTHNVCMDCIIKIGRQNIQLPSDEEIEDASLEENNDDLSPAEEFQRGAKWMRDKIQGGSK